MSNYSEDHKTNQKPVETGNFEGQSQMPNGAGDGMPVSDKVFDQNPLDKQVPSRTT